PELAARLQRRAAAHAADAPQPRSDAGVAQRARRVGLQAPGKRRRLLRRPLRRGVGHAVGPESGCWWRPLVGEQRRPAMRYQLQKLIREVNRSPEFRSQYLADPEPLMARYALADDEKAALRDRDYGKLYAMGV